MSLDGACCHPMHPYRSAPERSREGERPWPWPLLFLAGILTWGIVVHGLGALAGRW